MEIVKVEVSLLNAEKEDIIPTIYNLEVAGVDYFHIDVMDGKFVENNTIDRMKEFSEYIKNISNVPIDVHLMVEDINSFVEEYLPIEPNQIIFQIEACKNEDEVLKQIKHIKDNNCKVGISLNPNTKLEKIYKYLPYIHTVLIMTVEPGKGGQSILPETFKKIEELNKFVYENGYDIDIMVDGGINDKTSKDVVNAGANILVSGVYIIKSENFKEAVENLKK